jgi:hypothetical protein
MTIPARLENALERVRRSRMYTQQFLRDLSPDDWFWSPSEYTTHIAWQVAHIAASQYSLCLRRVRGRTNEDESLISDQFIDAYKIGSTPLTGAANNLPLEEIQRVFDAVHEQALSELALFDIAELDSPVDQPHPVFKTKFGAVDYSSQHELVHAGQIAMLRRMTNKASLR